MATVVVEGAPRDTRAARSRLCVGLALSIAAIVFAGFSTSFYGTFVEGVTHRTVGNYGIAYGALVFVVGLIVAIAMPVINVHEGRWDSARAERFLGVAVGDMMLFGGFFGAAVAYRRRPEIGALSAVRYLHRFSSSAHNGRSGTSQSFSLLAAASRWMAR